jgi:DUF4097 and DUF4098 domain-containing protein YvlB
MKHRNVATWVGVVLGSLLALALNVTLAHASNQDNWVREEFHQTYPLTANGRVALENINGAVHISAWDQNQVKVDAVKRAYDDRELKDTEIRVEARANAISISTHYRSQENGWTHERQHPAIVEYTLTVPRNARLDEIKLINGPLDVAGVLGEVRASCINGKLAARGLRNDVSLSTINGPLDASFDQLTSRVELASVNGPVQLTLPSDAKASIEATTVHGRIANEFGLHVNNHRFVGHDLRGQLGGGGTQIKLNNVNGPIEVHRANDGRALSPAENTDQGADDNGI